MPEEPLTEVMAKIHDILKPLSPDNRSRVVASVFALLGEGPPPPLKNMEAAGTHASEFANGLGRKANQWMKQCKIDMSLIENVFHIAEGEVGIIASEIPGATKKEQTAHAYMLVGIKSLLANDNPAFSDSEALKLCQQYTCYDKNNHSTNRKAIGNKLAGDRRKGLSLTQPGLKAAGELIHQIAKVTAG